MQVNHPHPDIAGMFTKQKVRYFRSLADALNWISPDAVAWTIMTSQPDDAEHALALEAAGIALTDSYMGARSRDVRDKVGVFLSGKRVGLSLLRNSKRYTAGSLSVVLKRLPGVNPASSTARRRRGC